MIMDMDKRGNGITWEVEKDFLAKYRALMERVKRGDQTAYYQVKELRAKEFRNTVEIVNQGYYVAEGGNRFDFPDDSGMIRNTVFYDREMSQVNKPEGDEQTIVEVQNIDCLYAGVRLKEQGYNPAVLNMASRRNPGGGVATGAGAQEETLFRRTNLFRSLYQFAPYAEQYGIRHSRYQYPLDRNFGGAYTPDAIYFRESELKGYALLEEPVSLSFITVAGMNRPLANGHDSLVLGALGCGAFRNPPRHVARLFHEVMDEPEFRNRYRRIVFAILDDHNAHQKHNPEGNFKPFADEFAGMVRPKLTEDEVNALMMWKMGAGNSAKRFNGEDPIPTKTKVATKDSWKTEPMPAESVLIPMNVKIPRAAMQIVKCGHIPDAMEDHWFMYCDGSTIRYYRSWTGFCIFIAKFVEEGDMCAITELQVNRDSEQYGSKDNDHDVALFMALLTEEYGGDASKYWDKAF